jgi:hypothetical protein
MKRHSILFILAMLTLLTLVLAACAAPASPTTAAAHIPTAQPAPVQQTYSDPFAYCAAVGTVDAPDARYIGEPVPASVIDGYKTAAGLEASTEPLDMLQKTTTWRCMNGQVYACNIGANLPCSSKANVDKTPTLEMTDFCKANPGSDFIPMSVTGHETVYSWHCVKDAPEALEQVEQVDAAGYIADIWYPIEKP